MPTPVTNLHRDTAGSPGSVLQSYIAQLRLAANFLETATELHQVLFEHVDEPVELLRELAEAHGFVVEGLENLREAIPIAGRVYGRQSWVSTPFGGGAA